MDESRIPRHRGAIRASLGMLALLLLCQAAFPVDRTREQSETSAEEGSPTAEASAAAGSEERRLGWFGFGKGKDNGNERKKGGTSAAQTGGGKATKGEKLREKKKLLGGNLFLPRPESLSGGGSGGRDSPKKREKHSANHKLAHVPVSETVDLTTDKEGLLWLPVSMSPPTCPRAGGGEDGRGCESTIRFCQIKIDEYQEAPWKFPMTTMLEKRSQCRDRENMRAFRLSALRVYMQDHPDEFLQPNGFVFHETRTGSTLVANMLAHVPENLVMSENNVAEDPIRHCHDCTDDEKVSLLRDVLRVIGNGRNGHKHLFFKFQDAATMKLITRAFPDVGWVYLFRDPVEVMVSNLKGAYGKRKRFYNDFDFEAAANVTANHELDSRPGDPEKPMMSPCLLPGYGTLRRPSRGQSKEETCANRLKNLCQAAADTLEGELQQSGGGRGAVVEYTNLPDVMTEFIYPSLFRMGDDKLKEHLPYLSEAARMYSKSMSNPESEFSQGTDKSYKLVLAEKAYKDAAESTGLSAVYKRLQELQTWRKNPEATRV